MSRRAFVILTVLSIGWQWLAVSAVSAQGQTDQAADPIVQAQWSALVEAASNAQETGSANVNSEKAANLNGSPSLNDISSNSSLLVPQMSNVGNSGGVDIIGESLKYHNSSMQSEMQMQSGMFGANQGNGNFVSGGNGFGQMQNGFGQMRNNFNSYGMPNGMQNNGFQNNFGVPSNNFQMPASGFPMQNQMMMNSCCQHQHQQQNHCCGGHGANQQMSNGSSDGLNTQAIGVLGASALMGVFMQKGGVGGILQDIGWDGNRHVRGSSIGGY